MVKDINNCPDINEEGRFTKDCFDVNIKKVVSQVLNTFRSEKLEKADLYPKLGSIANYLQYIIAACKMVHF